MQRTAVEEREIRLGDRRCVYHQAGASGLPPLLALHGLISHAGIWDDFAAGLADQRQVLAPDLRGHGGSDWSDDYSQDAWVADVGLFADALGLKSFDLIGHSMGGRVAWMFAAEHPERVSRLIILDIVPFKPNNWPAAPGTRFATLEDAVAAAREPRYVNTREDLFRRFAARHFEQSSDGSWIWRSDPKLRRAPTEAPGFSATVEEQWAALRQVQCPTLIVSTELNTFQPRAGKEEMVAAMPDARLVDIQGVGHDVLLEQPEALVAAVRTFLT
jgi:pimeloyl-ACP methyl ester carboxylesterase